MQKRIYFASPYSSPVANVRERRFEVACAAAAELMRQGDLVFSPIAHSHVLAKHCGLRGDFEFWRDWCLSFLRHWATDFVILELPGWKESRGIAAERTVARELGLAISRLPVINVKGLQANECPQD